MGRSSSLFVMFVYLFPILFHHCFCDSQAVPRCDDEERSALLELKQSFREELEYCHFQFLLVGDYRKLESWKPEEGGEAGNCCTWSGVRCDEQTGKVIGLDLSNACLYGAVNSSSSLFRLVHLEHLNLTFNNLSFSPIPPELGNLSSLTVLRLAGNTLTGEIPDTLGNLAHLSFLDLSVNQLTGRIPSSFRKLSQLSRLELAGNHLTGQIPEFFWGLTQLARLDLSDNQFTGPVPSLLANLIQLTNLDLSLNRFSGQIPSSFGNLTRLRQLDMRQNQLIGQIPESLMNLRSLTDLSLSSNNLTGPIPSQIGSLVHLEYLRLSWNRLDGPIPASISHLSNLTFLDLYSNKLNGDLKMATFSGLKQLNTLILSLNDFSLFAEPDTSSSYPQIWAIGLASCNLREFPEFLKGQHDLAFLDLSYNNISGQIPGWFSGFLYMRALNLSGNSLTGFGQQPVFQDWKQLGSLDLRFNQLQGPIPAVPSVTTRFYFISNNQFSGIIPSSMMCNLSNIQVLDLAKNNLGGTIPPCLSNLSSMLAVLSLHDNDFYGGIPEVNGNSCRLRMIDFSSNRLEGPLPRSLANCTDLEFLNVGNNMMDDMFPSWLGELANLKVLILRANRLHGIITKPDRNGTEFPMLQIVDLSKNKLAGSLPSDYFRSWKAMSVLNVSAPSYFGESVMVPIFFFASVTGEYDFTMTIINKGMEMVYSKILDYLTVIDLSSNDFSGEIPASIGSLEGLHMLNLSNNRLSGHIPAVLNGLSNLEALDLSSNSLSGEIPMQLTALTYLAVFNVSYNNLSGPIPRVKQFNTFDNRSYEGNDRLCGDPLSRKCGPEDAIPPATSRNDDGGSNGLFEFNLKIIVMGFVSGLVIGLVLGQGIPIGRDNWFVRKFGQRYQRRRA